MSNAFITRRAGGVNLNFRITQYNIGTDLSNIIGKPNEIAILTDNKIDGWQFSYAEPELPYTGMLWIKLANTGYTPFNAIKKNAIILMGAAAFQYLTGAWQAVDAQIYQGGRWNDFRHYLFREGMGQIIPWRGNGAVFTDESIVVNGVDNRPAIATYDMFDFSNYAKLFLELTPNLSTSNNYRFNVVFSKKNTGAWADYYSATQNATPDAAIQCEKYLPNVAPILNGERSTLEINIADAVKEEPCYVVFAHFYVKTPAFTVHNVWLE